MYFGLYIGDYWNLMNEKLSKLLTNCINLLENYNENNELIISQNYRNKTLSNIESILIESKILNT